MEKLNYVYILDSAPHLFIGVTGDLEKRVAQPRRKLVWFEPHADLRAAIEREKQLKRWNRAWKAKLVSNHNPEWRDLYEDFVDWLPSNKANEDLSNPCGHRIEQHPVRGAANRFV